MNAAPIIGPASPLSETTMKFTMFRTLSGKRGRRVIKVDGVVLTVKGTATGCVLRMHETHFWQTHEAFDSMRQAWPSDLETNKR